MECIAIINQKGGVGKTSTAVNLGAGLAQRGKRLLLIDLDPQGHLTTHFGLDADSEGRTIYEVFTRDLPFDDAIHTYSPGISVVPSNVDLAAAEVELVSVVGREVILRDLLAEKERPYDIVMIDCPPSLGVLSLNALSAATRVVIPVQPHFLALQGAGKLFETISLVNHRLNPRVRVAGMVMCLYDAGTRLSAEVVDDLSKFLESSRGTPVPWRDARIFDTVIRRNVKLAECPSYGQSIFEYAPRSNGATDYLALADELLSLIDGPSATPAENVTTTAESSEASEAVKAGSTPTTASRSAPAAPVESASRTSSEVPEKARSESKSSKPIPESASMPIASSRALATSPVSHRGPAASRSTVADKPSRSVRKSSPVASAEPTQCATAEKPARTPPSTSAFAPESSPCATVAIPANPESEDAPPTSESAAPLETEVSVDCDSVRADAPSSDVSALASR